jgi:hypothetical protein
MYWLNYLDRNAIALAQLNKLEDDLGLEGTRMLIILNYDEHRLTVMPFQNIKLASASSSSVIC